MPYFNRIHRRTMSKARQLSFISLFLALGLAAMEAAWSLHLDSFGISPSTIGFASSALVVIGLAVAIILPRLFERQNLRTLFITSIIISVAGYAIISLTDNFWLFISIAGVTTTAGVLRLNTSSILFRENVTEKNLNKAEGFLYALLNVGWLAGPFIAALVLYHRGTHAVFLTTALLLTMGLLCFLPLKIRARKKRQEHTPLLGNIKEYFRHERLKWPYLIVMGLETWWAFVYIYVPLIIIKNGGTETLVAAFLGLITVPLIINDYAIGKISEKVSFKSLFMIGFTGMAGLAILAFLSGSLYAQLCCIVIASLFVSFVEPLQDTFFFKQVGKGEEKRYYPLFTTSGYVGGFLGQFSVAAALLFLPLGASYLIIASLMLAFAWLSWRIP